jgi:DNA-directed RNA polymerase subunit RPC12/RpoP
MRDQRWEPSTRCDWEEDVCTNSANHLVYITFPDEPTEIWRVCRAHDRELKRRAVARRIPTPDQSHPESPSPAPTFHCSDCGAVLDEPVSGNADSRSPCPHCGSTVRTVKIISADTVTAHEAIGIKQKHPGKGGWLKEIKAGDDYTRDLEAWGERKEVYDREHGLYQELIRLYDGTTVESTAPLGEHKDR